MRTAAGVGSRHREGCRIKPLAEGGVGQLWIPDHIREPREAAVALASLRIALVGAAHGWRERNAGVRLEDAGQPPSAECLVGYAVQRDIAPLAEGQLPCSVAVQRLRNIQLR